MQWNSGPESPREKWEYRRAQKEWDKLRQKERGAYHYQYPYAPPRKKPMVRPGFLIALVAVLHWRGICKRTRANSGLWDF